MTLESFLRRVVSIVEDAGIPYMIKGSLAAAFYARPRATRDVDLVVAASPDEIVDLADELEAEGFYVDRRTAQEVAREYGQFNAIDPASGWKVDWIVRRDRPFSRTEFERRRRVTMMDMELYMVTAEDLIVAKLEWARRGASELQLRDARAVLVQRGGELDRAHIERWVARLGLRKEWNRVLEASDPSEEA